MKGRLEHTIQNERKIERLLGDCPDCVTDFYLSRVNKESMGVLEYIRKIHNFLQFLSTTPKEVDVTKITDREIAKYLKSIEVVEQNGELRPTTKAHQKQIHSILKAFFTYLRKSRKIDSNPVDLIDRPTSQDTIKRIRLTESDLLKIVAVTSNRDGDWRWRARDKAIILLLINTGVRKTALSEINVEDVDLNNGTLTVVDKRNKTHIYYLNGILKRTIEIWIRARRGLLKNEKTDALFISARKQRIAPYTIQDLVEKYSAQALGYSISPHKIRAAFCTILYDKTGDIEFVRDAVGHSDVATTQRYIVKDDSARVKASEIMEKMFD